MNKLTIIFLMVCHVAYTQGDFPKPLDPPKIVNDFTGTLSEQQLGMLESKLRTYRDTTSNEIGVVIVSTTGNYEIAQYAVELAERWGIGKKAKNNGVLLLVAVNDRRVNISTGYGLEPVITDAHSKRIIQNYILPNFKNGDYFTGIDQATSVLMSLASGEFTADPNEAPKGGGAFALFMLILFIFFIVSSFKKTNKGHYASKPMDPLTTLIMMGGLSGKSGRGYSDFSRGGGVFGGGGGSSFGGFGGGSFGGGGASGSW